MTLSFSHVHCTLAPKKKEAAAGETERVLLNDVSGEARPGRLLAVCSSQNLNTKRDKHRISMQHFKSGSRLDTACSLRQPPSTPTRPFSHPSSPCTRPCGTQTNAATTARHRRGDHSRRMRDPGARYDAWHVWDMHPALDHDPLSESTEAYG